MRKEYVNYGLMKIAGDFLSTTPDFNLFTEDEDFLLVWDREEVIRTKDEEEFLNEVIDIIKVNN